MDIVESTVARYTGEARLQRLVYIVSHASGDHPLPVMQAAREAAVFHAKNQCHLHRVRSLRAADTSWLQEQESRLRHARNVLTSRLQTAQAHLNKEAIRTAYLALAQHDTAAGDLQEALHAVLRAKDYCTSRQQTAQVSLQIVQLAMYLQHYNTVREYVNKIEHTLGQQQQASDSETIQSIRMQVMVAAGLERLAAGEYATAARKFRAVATSGQLGLVTSAPSSGTSGSSSNPTQEALTAEQAPAELLAPDDIALYAAFLSLACVDSRESLVQLAEDPEALELVPPLREALDQFGRLANYRGMWEILEKAALPGLSLDLYMGPHLPKLMHAIRETAIQYYWKPYRRLPCAVMAEQLGPGLVPEGPKQLQAQLVDLIGRGALPKTRLDMATGTLVRTTVDRDQALEMETAKKLQRLQKSVVDETHFMVVRMACLEFDLSVVDPQHRSGGGMRGGRHFVDFGEDEEDMMDTTSDQAFGAGDMNPEDLY